MTEKSSETPTTPTQGQLWPQGLSSGQIGNAIQQISKLYALHIQRKQFLNDFTQSLKKIPLE
jgi:hypothetical protein